MEYPVSWSEQVIEVADNSHKVIQLAFDSKKFRAPIPRDDAGQQFGTLNLAGHFLE